MLLSDGAGTSAVVDGLDDMIRRLENVTALRVGPASWSVAQNGYLQLVETLERALRSWFEDDDGTGAGLFGEHYRLIRDMSASTPRGAPLIGDEVERQVRALRGLREKAAALQSLRARPGIIAFPDTNRSYEPSRPRELKGSSSRQCHHPTRRCPVK